MTRAEELFGKLRQAAQALELARSKVSSAEAALDAANVENSKASGEYQRVRRLIEEEAKQ